MKVAFLSAVALMLVVFAGAVRADPTPLDNGGDVFLSGTSASASVTASRDC